MIYDTLTYLGLLREKKNTEGIKSQSLNKLPPTIMMRIKRSTQQLANTADVSDPVNKTWSLDVSRVKYGKAILKEI